MLWTLSRSPRAGQTRDAAKLLIGYSPCMSAVVLGYPTLEKHDFEWIQLIRKANDRLFSAVDPHFTFVFPTEKLSAEELIRHVRSKIERQPKITVQLTDAIVVRDDSSMLHHTFLIPSVGSQEIVAVHDMLYTDCLASELRSDEPFVPHIGVGTSGRAADAHELADSLNHRGINITGIIESLTVSRYDGFKVKDIEEISLA
jgi:2'-5' RNA ligase